MSFLRRGRWRWAFVFWECSFPPLVHVRESLEFSYVVNLDKTDWPRCLLRHGWLPALSGRVGGTPWANDAADVAKNQLEVALGFYVGAHSVPFEGFQLDGIDRDISACPFVWTDGSLVLDKVSEVWLQELRFMPILLASLGSIGSGVILICCLPCLMQVVKDVDCSALSRVPYSRFSVLKSGEFWLHFRVALLNVVNHVSCLIANRWAGRPFPPVNDGDLLHLAQRMVRNGGRGNTQVSQVKGHADEGMVALGRVREIDRTGNNEADAAADMGRRRVHGSITDARRLVTAACAGWYQVVKDLQHFFIAIARTVVNHGGSRGTSLHPMVWLGAANLKRRRVDRAVRDMAWLPGPASLWTSDWECCQRVWVTAADIQVWPFSVGLLAKVFHFLASLHWPVSAHDLGVGSVSFLS